MHCLLIIAFSKCVFVVFHGAYICSTLSMSSRLEPIIQNIYCIFQKYSDQSRKLKVEFEDPRGLAVTSGYLVDELNYLR